MDSGTYENATPRGNVNLSHVNLLDDQQFWLAILVLLFGLVILAMQYRLLSKYRAKADEILRTFTTSLIVVVSLALVASGYGEQQISPVLGLFGTIVGYLLGASRNRDTGNRQGTDSTEIAEKSDE
ncbi:hypothetical protein [Paraburkholderia pallida]|uniref:Uncharacterized protein n=1 Tax=Paraburkholderia pallida TaxID=2547399 RepID=A0A4P7D4L0_9BURK|nr:hypothetical protein [Paraburkholderia pallida]QBR03629.1 hypothetical protein E1956_41715 [Paraburkholderia pallida]